MNYILPEELGYGAFITTIPDCAVEIYHTTIHHKERGNNDEEEFDYIWCNGNEWHAVLFQGMGLFADYDLPEKPDLNNYKKIEQYYIQL